MSNPLTMKSWSPYAVGVGIGVLSWFAFASANKHLAITLQFEHMAALAQSAVMPDAARQNPYYAVRAAEGKSPKVSWELMLLVGVFIGGMPRRKHSSPIISSTCDSSRRPRTTRSLVGYLSARVPISKQHLGRVFYSAV